MDFLDPRKRRAHKIRLLLGYALVAVAIILASIILYYGAYGYSINTKTGEVIQNGLLFVDSHPGGADISLNGKSINATTSSRLVLPSGSYDLSLKKAGYTSWQRKFVLDPSGVARYVYPFLWPTKPFTKQIKGYSAQPALFSESPDRHWVLLQEPSPDLSSVIFDQIDISAIAQNPLPVPVPLTLPAGILTNPGGTLAVVEWSTDNNHLLLQHTFSGGSEFIVFSRADPTTSFSVNKLFNANPSQVFLRNKKADQLYLYDQKAQTVALGNVSNTTVSAPTLSHVLAFKPYGPDTIIYATDSSMPAGKAQVRFWDGNKSYALAAVHTGAVYLLDIAKFQGHTYYVAGSNTTERTLIFEDPLDDIQNPQINKAEPLFGLNNPSSNKVEFSANARFVAIQSGQDFATYDFEESEGFQYTLAQPLSAPMVWMDGHRLIGQSDGSVLVIDYDGTNLQRPAPSLSIDGALFSRDYNQMLTIVPGTGNNPVVLQRVDLRAGVDLPKNP